MQYVYFCTVPSGPPLNISAVEVFSRSFTLTWDLPAPSERNGIITGYNITVTSLDSLFEDPQVFFTTSQSLTIDSLDPHTDYVCVIAAITLLYRKWTILSRNHCPYCPRW